MMLNLFSPCFNKFTYTYHTKQVCECYVVYFITKPSTLFTITDINIHVLAKNKHLYQIIIRYLHHVLHPCHYQIHWYRDYLLAKTEIVNYLLLSLD